MRTQPSKTLSIMCDFSWAHGSFYCILHSLVPYFSFIISTSHFFMTAVCHNLVFMFFISLSIYAFPYIWKPKSFMLWLFKSNFWKWKFCCCKFPQNSSVRGTIESWMANNSSEKFYTHWGIETELLNFI